MNEGTDCAVKPAKGHKTTNHGIQTMSIMKKLKLFAALLAALTITASTALAAGEVTITGNMVCGKCTLHETETCQNVVQVTEDGKTVNYYLKENEVSKAEHAAICKGGSEKVTVTGKVKEKDGKKTLTATKIEVVKTEAKPD